MREGIELPDGRRVTQLTSSVRSSLAAAFNAWLRDEGFCFDEVFHSKPPDLDRVNQVLTRYGRYLFSAGKPSLRDNQLDQYTAPHFEALTTTGMGPVCHVDLLRTGGAPPGHAVSTCLVWGWV